MVEQNEIEKVIKLAKIEVAEDKKSEFLGQVTNILNYIKSLEEVDTKNIKNDFDNKKTILRKDEIRESIGQKLANSNAPQSENNMFIVPQII